MQTAFAGRSPSTQSILKMKSKVTFSAVLNIILLLVVGTLLATRVRQAPPLAFTDAEIKAAIQAELSSFKDSVWHYQKTSVQASAETLQRIAKDLSAEQRRAVEAMRQESERLGKEMQRFIYLETETALKETAGLLKDESGKQAQFLEELRSLAARTGVPALRWEKNTKWADLGFSLDPAAPDSGTFDVKLHNAFGISSYMDGGTPKVAITNFNPYTETLPGTNEFILDPGFVESASPFSRWALGLQAGVGLNAEMKLSPYIGLGIQYAVFRFKRRKFS